MIRGQLCLYETKTDQHGWSASGGVGIIEAPTGALIPERILGFTGLVLGTDHLFAPRSYAERPVYDAGHEMADHVRDSQWPRPVPGSGIPGGGLLFRRTRVPGTPGHEVMTVAICMYAPTGSVRSQMLYSLSATDATDGVPSRISMHSPVLCEPLAENGIGMTALLKRPVWGWGAEPFGLQSTMRINVIDQAMECARLLDAGTRTPEEDARLAELRGTHGYDVVAHNRTGYDAKNFAEFRRRMTIVPPHDDWSQPVSAQQMREHDQQAAAVIRQMLATAA